LFPQPLDDSLEDDSLPPFFSHSLVFRTYSPVLLVAVVIHLETVVGGLAVDVTILLRVHNAYIFTTLSHFDFIYLGVVYLVQLE